MSQEPVVSDAVPVLQPLSLRRQKAATRELHPQLCEQLDEARLSGAGTLELSHLLPLISAYYSQLDDERRGIVRSMQLIADEARSFGDGLAGADAGHLQAILDHIKDVVITVSLDGSVKIFNPTGERVFGYSRSEVIGQSIARLLPELPLHGSVEQGLRALASDLISQDIQSDRRARLRLLALGGHRAVHRSAAAGTAAAWVRGAGSAGTGFRSDQSRYSIRPASASSATRARRSSGSPSLGCCRNCRCMGPWSRVCGHWLPI